MEDVVIKIVKFIEKKMFIFNKISIK